MTTQAITTTRFVKLSRDLIDKAQDILDQYKYGIDIDGCLAPDSAFRIEVTDKGVFFRNYCVLGSRKGICADLAVQAGVELKEALGDNVEIRWVKGSCSEFDSGQHFFLLMWQNTQANLKIAESIIPQKPYPEGVALLDPSFARIYENAQESGYVLQVFTQVSEQDFDPDIVLPYSEVGGITRMQPIGFLNEILPEHPSTQDKDILFIGFESDNGRDRYIKLRVVNGTNVRQLSASEIIGKKPQTPLGRFLIEVDKAIA